MIKSRLLLMLAGLFCAGPALAQSDDWKPTQPIRLIVPFPPGGLSDGIVRVLAPAMSVTLGQPVVVENRSGGNGAVAGDFVTRSRPDGHAYILLAPSNLMVLPAMMTLNYDPMKDLVPVSNIASNPYYLAVPTASGVRSLAELVAKAKAAPGQLNYASGGSATGTHLAMLLLLMRTGTEMQHIPYRGGAPAMQDLAGNRVATYFGNPTDVAPFMDGATVLTIASSGSKRASAFPSVPTVVEAGFPDIVLETWNGLLTPRGTPVAAINKVAAAVAAACATTDVRAALQRLGVEPVCNSPEEFNKQMQAEAPVWEGLAKRVGTRLD